MCYFKVSIIYFSVFTTAYLTDKHKTASTVVFKNNSLYFCHINQNFNVLLYKSFHKFPSDRKITIMLHRRTHTNTRSHTYTQKQRCAICDLALWTHGAVCIDLLVRVAMQCNNCYVCRTSLSLRPHVGRPSSHTRPGLQINVYWKHMYRSHEYWCTDRVMAGVCKC